MKTIITTLFIALSLVSCQIKINQVKGNGNVITEDRTVSEPFNQVKVARGLHLILKQGTENKITVEADENLHELITTTITNGKLTVTSTQNIGRASAKNIYVTYAKLNEISASSGADVSASDTIKSETLTLDASSGADINVVVFSKELYLDCSSGADIEVSGKAKTLNANASSGSDIDTEELSVSEATVKASSGADITVNVLKRLEATASSGGHINYYGNPKEIIKHKSASGGGISNKG